MELNKMIDVHKFVGINLEKMLSYFYDEHNITSGDISPEQTMRWNDLVEEISNFFIELIEQNKTEDEPKMCFTVKDMIEFGNTCREIGRRDLLNNIDTIFGGKSENKGIQPKVEEIFNDWVQEGEDTLSE